MVESVPPLPWRWQARSLLWLDFPMGKFLDYGCGSGWLMISVQDRCAECHGVDVRSDKLRTLRMEHSDFTLRKIDFDGKTDYPDNFFDTIAMIEVIEHVGDERKTLREIARILKPHGKLLLTTPHKGLLTFLDVGNVKFAFPRLHRLAHRLNRDPTYYQKRFGDTHGDQLVGDITVTRNRRPWHRHYKPHEIQALCQHNLVLRRHEVYFPGMRALMFLRVALRVACLRLFKPFPQPLPWLERRLSQVASPWGDQLVMMFEKLPEDDRTADSEG